jgi:hypothetical protein
MGYRLRKQLTVIFIILFVLGLIGFIIYWQNYRTLPTCFDKIQNQEEESADCGGPCISCERLTIKDVQVEWAKFLLLQENQYDLIAKIVNPNPNFGLAQINYTFKLYNSSGEEIKEQNGSSFILPGEEKYLIEGGMAVQDVPGGVDLVIEKADITDWQKFNADYSLPNIYILNKEFKPVDNQPGVSQASGLIRNDSAFDFDKIIVSIVLFDGSGQIIGVNKTQANTVLAGEQRYFSALWYTPISGQVASVEMQADTNLLSDENFISKYGVPEKFQQYPTPTR